MQKPWAVFLILAALWGAEIEPQGLAHYSKWNLSNNGISSQTSLMLHKQADRRARWTATIRLRNYYALQNFVGQRLYFYTEYSGDDVARLAPSFYVQKGGQEYLVWWTYPNTTDRFYPSFRGNGGLIIGALDIPAAVRGVYYAQSAGGTPFAVTDAAPVTLADIREGLRTDWQHDIPGAYDISAQEHFPGLAGTAVFKRFYLGAEPPEAVLLPEQAGQLDKLTAREREILADECGLPSVVFGGEWETRPDRYYACSADVLANALDYYRQNKKYFTTDIYYQKKNYLPRGSTGFNINVIASEPGLQIENQKNLLIQNKKDPDAWTIISLGDIADPQKLAELKGPVRLLAWFEAVGLRPGFYNWQNIFLDVAQYDRNGKDIGHNDELTVPVSSRAAIVNYDGVLTHEFILAKDAVRIELFLKIAGAPDTDKTKHGVVVDRFDLRKAALQKGTGVLDAAKLFTDAGVPATESGSRLTYHSAGTGLYVGDRWLTVDAAKRSVRFDLKNEGGYSGFYTNIFDVSRINEIEMSSIMSSELQKHGSPPDWAVNALEIVYFEASGRQVYPADNGAERYPRIAASAPNLRQARKGLFVVPHERGAQYAQIRMHFVRENNQLDNRPSTQNFFAGQASSEYITLRPALQNYNADNVLPNNGSFYDNINGQPLSWTVQGAYVDEDLPNHSRKVVFDNWSVGGWSAVKTEIDIPASANALRGKLNVQLQKIETGLNQWEGFGFFLEADVRTPSGALFHYSGVPVFEKKGDTYVQLGRMSASRQGLIEYYIPLYHENQKIVKLYWQIALLGKGRAELLPLENKPEASILNVELLQEKAFNPLFWSQYSLYSADGNAFQFQKKYELKTGTGVYSYDYAEVLAERLRTTGLEGRDISAELKALPLHEVKKTAKYEIKTLPAYGRVSTLADFDGQVIEVSFKTSGTADGRFNLQAFIVNEANGNVHQAPIYRLETDGSWKTIDRVFPVGGTERFIIDSSEYPGRAKKVLITLGGFYGIVNYSDLTLTPYTKFDRRNLSGAKTALKISAPGDAQVLAAGVSGQLNNANLVDLTKQAQPLAFFSAPAQNLDAQIRAAVKSNGLTYNQGAWGYQRGKDFALSGITLVGETFKEWQRLHGQNLQQFCREQGVIWQKAGLNTIRVHQIFTSWADLAEEDLDELLQALKNWQAAGFVIIVDALPNTDFTASYFGQDFAGKPYSTVFSGTNDLFKATLVLPEVRDGYVKPALAKLARSFSKNNFWPDSLTYANETGFTRGFWTIDKNNPLADEYFSKIYHFYYGRYLERTRADKVWQGFIESSEKLLQEHRQGVNLRSLLADVTALNNAIADQYYVKDTAGYIYYNILRDEVLNSYPVYQKELSALREDGYSWITNAEPTGNYVNESVKLANKNKERIAGLLKRVDDRQDRQIAKDWQALLTTETLRGKVKEVYDAVFAVKMPDNYQIPSDLTLGHVDDFLHYDRQQVFFTSFLLPIAFTQDVNAFLRTLAPRSFVVGLNNDYARDVGALLGNAYLFFNDPQTELRFNKYAHHPIGGHSMLMNPGFGNVFDEDSNIDLNLDLFTPPSGYPAQLSETNFTFAGDDNAGEGTWTIMDYLKNAAKQHNILFFHYGPDAADKPIINDYFNMGNRPYQLNAIGLVSSVALHKRLDAKYIQPGDFLYDRFQEKIDLKASGVNGIAGRVQQGKELKGRGISFVYKGNRPQTNVTVIEQKLGGQGAVIYLFGLERNKNQQNRAGNPDLIQSFGVSTIQYESLPGVVKIADRQVSKITGYYPSGQTVEIPLRYLRLDNGVLALDLTAFPGIVCCHLAR
ncbi:hypothetical protein NO2_0511 [Candidatus Termititenax persephonae]|uniref:Uncharacterized protein n=1 Tax=Candidatus Termititenax persephonae TaxID=2218525 RepID=A0A388TGV5_9BACT|nr:hypothetical protein NO2_0511 [Candidatus Termititenax persephonae]